MENENIEQKLKLENEVNNLKREHKKISSLVSSLKLEHDSLVSIVEKKKVEKEEQDKYLKNVLNDIANAKVVWSQERELKEVELFEKNKEVDLIIAKKSELDIQEQENLKILEDNTKILNDNRVLLLELKDKEIEIETKIKLVEDIKLSIENERKLLADEVIDFKNKINRIVKEINK